MDRTPMPHLSLLTPARLRTLAALLLLTLAPAASSACERYFLMVFGSQKSFYEPQYTHSFAVFVRACGEGPCLDQYQMDWFTISWLSERMVVDIFNLIPEEGVNLDLQTTLQWCQCN